MLDDVVTDDWLHNPETKKLKRGRSESRQESGHTRGSVVSSVRVEGSGAKKTKFLVGNFLTFFGRCSNKLITKFTVTRFPFKFLSLFYHLTHKFLLNFPSNFNFPISPTKSLQISFVCQPLSSPSHIPPDPSIYHPPVSRLFHFVLSCICMWLRNNRSFPPLRKNRSFNFPSPAPRARTKTTRLMSIAQKKKLRKEETKSPWTSLDVRIFRSFS